MLSSDCNLAIEVEVCSPESGIHHYVHTAVRHPCRKRGMTRQSVSDLLAEAITHHFEKCGLKLYRGSSPSVAHLGLMIPEVRRSNAVSIEILFGRKWTWAQQGFLWNPGGCPNSRKVDACLIESIEQLQKVTLIA